MNKNIVTIHGSFIREFKTDIEDIDKAKEVCIKEVKEYLHNRNYQITDLSVVVTKYEEIINTLNGHDEKLVEVINILWNTESCRRKLQLIIKSLVLRDLEEFEDKMFEGVEEEKCWDLVKWCDTDFDECAYNYLHRCADDGDLETIIEFCRYWEKTINGGTRYLTTKGWVE